MTLYRLKISFIMVILAAISLFSISFSAYAAKATEEINNACTGPAASSALCRDATKTEDPLKGVLVAVLNILLFVVGALAVIFVIYGGFKYVKSAGDSNKVSEAKNTIAYALIGLLVALLANRIVVFLLNRLIE